MTILYLHGLNSTNVNDRTHWLSNYAKIINPLMDYKNIPESFQYLENLINSHKPDLIIGSSMGGFFAYHLGNYHGIPTILLNPALIMKMIVKPDNRKTVIKNKHYIAIGKNDDIVPPFTTKVLLKEDRTDFFIKEYPRGHETPLEDFIDICKSSGFFEK